jgi:hypothetical protein
MEVLKSRFEPRRGFLNSLIACGQEEKGSKIIRILWKRLEALDERRL